MATRSTRDENGFEIPEPVAASATPAPQPSADIEKILAPVDMTADRMAESYASNQKNLKEARIQQLAREYAEVRELLNELEQLRKAK